MNKEFESAYRIWLDNHVAQSSGERRRRLQTRHGFGEKHLLEHAWWPVVGNLNQLHPEYEFVAPDGKFYYIDLFYLRSPIFTCLEADGFSTHARDADRDSFSDGLDRQNEIVLSKWHILRFSVDKLKENPLSCQRHVRRMLEELYGEDCAAVSHLSIYQREIIRLATRSGVPITPHSVEECLGKKETFVLKQLHELVEEGWLEVASGTQRKRSYRLKSRQDN